MGFELGVKTSIFNNEMRKRRVERKLSQKGLAEKAGTDKAVISGIECFKRYPKYEVLEDIAAILDASIEILFPEWLREQKLRVSHHVQVLNVERIELNDPEILRIRSDTTLEKNADLDLLKNKLVEIMQTLSDREIKVLTMRFGLDGGVAKSLEEAAQEFEVTRERLRQIEIRALYKLRHHKESGILKEFLGGTINE